MTTKERRRHRRCQLDTSIQFSYLNRDGQHPALARNYCRSGMYFESSKAIGTGVIVLIRSEKCLEDGYDNTQPVFCSQRSAVDAACRDLKTMVTGQVKRCKPIFDDRTIRYGIAVEYVRPSI